MKKVKVKGAFLDKVTNLVVVLFGLSLVAERVVERRLDRQREDLRVFAGGGADVERGQVDRLLGPLDRPGRGVHRRQVGLSPLAPRGARRGVGLGGQVVEGGGEVGARGGQGLLLTGQVLAVGSAHTTDRSCYGERVPVHDGRVTSSGWRNWQTR